MIKINRSEISDEITVCPFCMDSIQTDPHMGCCGEVRSETAFVTKDGEAYLESEVEVEEGA